MSSLQSRTLTVSTFSHAHPRFTAMSQMSQIMQDPQRSHCKTLSLYEQDFLRWSEDTVAKLKARDFAHLDLENLIEEVESLGRSERKELLNRLIVILEHLLKRLYVPLPEDYNGWERTIRTQRNCLEVLLENSPSLKAIWSDHFDRAWKIALKTVSREYPDCAFPHHWPHPSDLESILDRDFWAEELPNP